MGMSIIVTVNLYRLQLAVRAEVRLLRCTQVGEVRQLRERTVQHLRIGHTQTT